MKELWAFIVLLAQKAMGSDPSPARPAGERHGLDPDPLRAKIAKFKAQAAEFDRKKLPDLARGYRESATLLERELRLREFVKIPASTRRAA